MGRGNSPNTLTAESSARSASGGGAYNNFFRDKMAQIDRTAMHMAPTARMHPEDVSEILKKGGLALLAGTVLLGPLGFAGAMAYIGFKSVRAWQRAKSPALDEYGQPLLDAQGRPLDQLGRPINPNGESMGQALRKAGLGGLLLGGGLAIATGGALLPMAAAGALGATGYHAIKNWKKLEEDGEDSGNPKQTEQYEDAGMKAFEGLSRSKEGQEMLEQTALSIYAAGGDVAGRESCIAAISRDLQCDPEAAAVLYEAVRAGCRSGVYPEETIFSGTREQQTKSKSSDDHQSAESKQEEAYDRFDPEEANKNASSYETRNHEKEKVTEEVSSVLCGRPTRSGSPCKMPAGWLTTHKGSGPCHHHGGTHQSFANGSGSPAADPNTRKNTVRPMQKGEIKSEADLKRRGQEVMQAAMAEGVELTPSFIANKLQINDDAAQEIYNKIQQAYPEAIRRVEDFSQPVPEKECKAKITDSRKKTEENYKNNPPANDQQRAKVQKLIRGGDFAQAIGMFDEAYFPPEERRQIIRQAYRQGFAVPASTKENVEATAATLRRAGLGDAADRVQKASQEEIAWESAVALEDHLENNRYEYWGTKTMRKEMFTRANNGGLHRIARKAVAPIDAKKLLTEEDYKAYQDLTAKAGISPKIAVLNLFQPLEFVSSDVAKEESQEKRSKILLSKFEKKVSRRIKEQANK